MRQVPCVKVRQDLLASSVLSPPQSVSPDCVWEYLLSGRSGREQSCVPSSDIISTEDPLELGEPPVMMIADK